MTQNKRLANTSLLKLPNSERLAWMTDENIRPYVYVRPENRIHQPGKIHAQLDWFPHDVLYKNPLEMNEVGFANQILSLEARAFGPSNMAMPRWVFYDCAILPGFVAGFAYRTKAMPQAIREIMGITAENEHEHEWTPLSLFIIIPTMSAKGEWVAHNLCSINSLLPKEESFYGIGFLSKAFSLWYANVVTNCGMTQWTSPAVRLHSHYGDFEILTAFTPVHSYARTLTYRVKVDITRWAQFFTKAQQKGDFQSRYRETGFLVDPVDEASLISFQRRLEVGEGPFFLDGVETLQKELVDPLTVYAPC